MGVAGDLLIALVGATVVLAAPIEIAFGALVVFWLLVPGNLSVPHGPHLLLVNRLVLYCFAIRLLVRRGAGQPRASAFSPTPFHGALGALLLVSFADGVVFAPSSNSMAGDIHTWLTRLDLVVLFVVVLAVVRTISPRRAVNIIVPVVAVAVVIGLFERWLHHGWSHFFFENLPISYLAPGSFPLQLRGGHVRSQGAGQFALEYGWVLAALLPLVVYAVIRWSSSRWRWLRVTLVLPLVAVVAVVFSGSRLPELSAVAATLLLVLLAGRDKRLVAWGIAAVGAGVIVALVDPSFISSPFSTGASDPASIRLDRLPSLFALVVHRPFTGLGFTGINSVFGGLDNSYALTYATLGMIGVLAFAALIVTGLASTARSLRAQRGSDDRILGVACLIGIFAIGVAAATYDLVDTPQSMWALTILAAIGVAVAEKVPRGIRVHRLWPARLSLPALGVAAGFGVLALTPASSSESFSIFTVAPWVTAYQGPVTIWKGTEMVDTLCPTVTSEDTLAPGTSVQCLQGSQIFPTDYAGLALVTIRGPTPAAVKNELKRAFAPIFQYMPLEGGPSGPMQTGKPSWAVTAPLSGGVAGLLAMLLFPPVPWRRRRLSRLIRERAAGADPFDWVLAH